MDFQGISAADETEIGASESKRNFLNEEGIYKLCVLDAQYGTSRSGNPQMVIDWVVSEGSKKGKTVRQFFPTESKYGPEKIAHLLKCLSASNAVPKSFDETNPQSLAGRECWAGVILEEYNGFMNGKVATLAHLNDQAKIKGQLERARKRQERKEALDAPTYQTQASYTQEAGNVEF